MSRMPTGFYFPGNSPVHQRNAAVKLLCLLILLAAVVTAHSLLGYCLIAGFILGTVWLSGVGIQNAVRSIARLWLFFLMIFGMNALFFEGGQVLWSWWIFRLSTGGMIQGANVILRVIFLMALCNVLTSTTSPIEITGAIESLLLPFKWIGLPTGDLAMILGVAIQFIPTFLEETDLIKKAQIARGAQLESRRLRDRAASLMPLVVPIFLSAFRRADELSVAMEARGYRRAKGRTKRLKPPLRWEDAAALAVSFGVCAVQIFY